MSSDSRPRPFARTALYLTGGLLIWAVNFLITYTFAALVCARATAAAAPVGVRSVSIATLISCAVALLANAGLIWHALSRYQARVRDGNGWRTDDFIDSVAGAVAVLSMVAVAWTSFVSGLPAGC